MIDENYIYERYEHAGVIVEIVQDDDYDSGPQDHDNAGTLYSWTSSFDGDERINEPDLIVYRAYSTNSLSSEDGEDEEGREVNLAEYMRANYDAALTVPLYFADYGSSGARIYKSDRDPNCALCFTQKEIDYEWSGHVDPYPVTMQGTGEVREYGGARSYAEARINELDLWLQGYTFGIVIRERDKSIEDPEEDRKGDVLESVWGFIGDPMAESGKYIRDEARSMAEGCAEQVEAEHAEAYEWACRDVVTV